MNFQGEFELWRYCQWPETLLLHSLPHQDNLFHLQNYHERYYMPFNNWAKNCRLSSQYTPLSTFVKFSLVQLLNRVWLFASPWTTACQASLSITNSRSLPKLMSIESVMQSNHLILCCPLLLLPSIFPKIRVFSNESALCIRWPSIGVSASTSVLPMNTQDWAPLGWTGWISLQSKGLSRVFSNTTVQKHRFFSTKLSLWSNSHPYMTTGKTIALTRWTFVDKIMPVIFNILSRLVITFLPRSKGLLISWLQTPSAVILEPPPQNLSLFPLFPHLFAMKWWDGCHDLSFLNVEL